MRSLKVKLTLFSILLGLTGVILVLLSMYSSSTSGIYEGAEARAEILSDEITYSLEILLTQEDIFSLQRLVEKSSTLEDVVQVIVVDTRQKVLAHTNRNLAGQTMNDPLMQDAINNDRKVSQNNGEHIIFVSPLHGQAYTSEFFNVVGALWVEIDFSRNVAEQQIAFGVIALGAMTILVVMFGIQYFTVKKIIIDRLRDVEVGIARSLNDDLSSPLAIDKSFGTEDEINSIAQTYNYLISSLHDSQKKIKSERDFALQIMESMKEGLTLTNADRVFEYVNPAYAHFLGLSAQEVIGKRPEDFTNPNDRHFLEAEWSVRRDGMASSYESSLVSKTGAETRVLISSVPRHVNGEFSGSIAVITDISQRARIEQMTVSLQRKLVFEELTAHLASTFMNMPSSEIGGAIQDALSRLGELFDVDRTYIFEVSPDGKLINNTHEWCAKDISPQIDNLQSIPVEVLPWWMSLLAKGETINVPRVSEMPPEAATEQGILAEQGIQSVLVTPIRSENELFGFLGLDSVVRERNWSKDEMQFLQVLMGIIMNTITRHRAEEKLRESEARNRAFLNAVPDLIFRIDDNGTFLDFRAGEEKKLYVPREAIIGNRLESIMPPDITQETMVNIKTALETGKTQKFEYRIKADNEILTYDAHVVPSGVKEVIVVAHDISERAHLEQMKSDFVNRASHELRTPLTTAILMATLLEGETTPEERLQFMDILKQQLNRQRLLLEDLLVAGRIENKRFQVHLSPTDVHSVLSEALSSAQPQADTREITIQLETDEYLPMINSDHQALIQIMLNLLSNAIKFSHPGGQVEVIVHQKEKSLHICVRDHGIGIPAQDLSHITNRFFRAQNATQMEIPGTGIGLYIIKEILESLGGRMEIESVEDQGTSMNIFLPLDLTDQT